MQRNYYFYPGKKKSFISRMSFTSIIILLNVIFFAVMSFFGQDFILNYIALKPSNIIQGKYLWTFITSMFMHGGIFHLFVNMLSLFFIGSLVEKILGAKRYLYFYLGAGLFASIFFIVISVLTHANLEIGAVGASGALFGLIGLLMLLTPNLPVFVMFIPIPIKLKYAAPGMLILLWIVSALADVPIGNTAHLGGLLAGIAFGIYLRKKFKRKTKVLDKLFS